MGRKGWKHEFDMACLLGSAIGVIENDLKNDTIDITEERKEKRKLAIEVFKKLAPSNINIGGQDGNPLRTGIVLTLPDMTKVDLGNQTEPVSS